MRQPNSNNNDINNKQRTEHCSVCVRARVCLCASSRGRKPTRVSQAAAERESE